MNIDILITKKGDAGLVCDRAFESPVAGVMFDVRTRLITLERADHESIDLNIPIEDEIAEALLMLAAVQFGVLADGKIQDNRQVPLMLLNDFEGFPAQARASRPMVSVTAFERFLKACVAGQPVHRDDLGDGDESGSVVGGLNRSVLEFAPHLARQKSLEATRSLDMSGPAPSAPAPGGMGGGGGGRRGGTVPPVRRDTPPQAIPPEEED